MPNLTEAASWVAGIYQIETTDPVVGGPNGVSNTQAKQLANRTAYLKGEVEQTQEDLQNLSAGVDDQAQNALVAAIAQALSLGGVNAKALEDLRARALSQGTAVLKNKWVTAGCALVKSDIRALHLTLSGAYVPGDYSSAYIDGQIRHIADDDYHVTVPSNNGASAQTYWAYLHNDAGVYRASIAETIPDDGLKLYEITVPAGDTANNLDAVTLTDRRTVQAYNGYTIGTVQEVYVALPYPALNAPDYDVALTVESATDFGAVGPLEVADKQQNGFKIRAQGSADNVALRWTLININR